MKKAIVCGAGGFIGSHLVKRLKAENYFVRGADIKSPEFSPTSADEFFKINLNDKLTWPGLLYPYDFDEIYQLAADMGGAGFVFTGIHDAEIIHNNALINLHAASEVARHCPKTKIFYSSSACMYPAYNQEDPNNPKCSEYLAYPAAPDSEYGWEKLFSEHVYLAWAKNRGLDVRIARYHNIFGPEGTWDGGREKAPAALCRKIAIAENGGEIEIWGDGHQTRSFLYIDECLEATRRLMASEFKEPVNIGSEEMVTINQLAKMIMEIAGKQMAINHIDGPLGVRGRNSDNWLLKKAIGWEPHQSLHRGLQLTYPWIANQVDRQRTVTGPEGPQGTKCGHY